MNYGYLYYNKLRGSDKKDLFDQLSKSIEVLKIKDQNYDFIYLYTDPDDEEIKTYSRNHGCVNKKINLSRKYDKDSDIILLDILVEKIIQLKNFDSTQDITLLDVDTLFLQSLPDDFWSIEKPVLWKPEYYITQYRNLDKILPEIPWHQIDIKFNNSFVMYNTGVIYIPKKHRKEICEKALWISDFLNNGIHRPEDRYGNKLDEQIGLSIAIHDVYGLENIRSCENYIHHYWEEKTKNIRWWE